MSDYLTRLIGRLRPEQEILQPVIPSRFAPVKTNLRGEADFVAQEAEHNPTGVRDTTGGPYDKVEARLSQPIGVAELLSARKPAFQPEHDGSAHLTLGTGVVQV